jgi:hypothetical protein
MKISELRKIRTQENAKTIDKAIAYIEELDAERDEEMTERMRLEEQVRCTRKSLETVMETLKNLVADVQYGKKSNEIGR